MSGYQFGYFVLSIAGHDKGELYVIMKEEDEYVYLINGLNKKLINPKKKNKKHVQLILNIDKELESKQTNGSKIIDEDIKRAIKLFQSKRKAKEV